MKKRIEADRGTMSVATLYKNQERNIRKRRKEKRQQKDGTSNLVSVLF
jgi:hypothetical protein